MNDITHLPKDLYQRYFAHRLNRLELSLGFVLLSIVNSIFNPLFIHPNVLGTIVYIILLLFNISLLWRRLQDINLNGWISLIILIPYTLVFFILLIFLLLYPGEDHDNKYGTQPKEGVDVRKIFGLSQRTNLVVGI